MRENMFWKKTLLSLFFIALCNITGLAGKWQDWELGGQLGLGLASASKSGGILCPAIMLTGTRALEGKFMELGMGYYFGSKIEQNYALSDIDEANYATPEQIAEYNRLVNEAGQDVKVRMSVIPMTVDFYYIIYNSFYVGGGAGLYHIFFKREPTGDYRVDIDSQPGEIVKSPSTTAIGFQQIVGVEIFPMSETWDWFISLKTFFTTEGGAAGRLFGLTLGGKVIYRWD